MKRIILLSSLLVLLLSVPLTLVFSMNYLYPGNKTLNEKEQGKYLIIDRFEGDFAVCENEKSEMINIERSKLPREAKEGHVLKIVGNRIEIDYEVTERRKNKILELVEDLWEN